MKKVSKQKQSVMFAGTVPQPYPIQFEGQEIEVNPVLSISQKKDFCDVVWSVCWTADNEDNFDYRPFMFDVAVRLMTLYCYTNLEIDLETAMDKDYPMIQYSGVYESVVSSFPASLRADYDALVGAAKQYVDLKYADINAMLSSAAKSQIDVLVEGLLKSVSSILDRFDKDMEKYAEAGEKYPLEDILSAAKSLTDVQNSERLISKILDYRDKKVEVVQDARPDDKV